MIRSWSVAGLAIDKAVCEMFLAQFPSRHTLGFPFLQSSSSKNVLKLITFPYPMRYFAVRKKGLLKSRPMRNDDFFSKHRSVIVLFREVLKMNGLFTAYHEVSVTNCSN